MEPIPDLGALKPLVDALVGRGLMLELTPPGRGQVVSHNLYTPSELAEVKARLAGGGAPAAPSERATAAEAAGAVPARERTVAPAPATHDRLTELAAEVTALRDEVARLRERIEALES
jgi:hypothetical protein